MARASRAALLCCSALALLLAGAEASRQLTQAGSTTPQVAARATATVTGGGSATATSGTSSATPPAAPVSPATTSRAPATAPGQNAGSAGNAAFQGTKSRANFSCPTVWQPVCGADSSTYASACVADLMNTPVASQGECKLCPQAGSKNVCGDQNTFSPVCGDGLTWTNAADATCNGHFCSTPGVCVYNAETKGTFEVTPPGTLTAAAVAAAAATTTLPAANARPYDYGKALHLSVLFYETQKSGILDKQRLAWRGDSCGSCKGPGGEDTSKGFLEAGGSYLKLGVPQAFTVTSLAYGLYAFPEGYDRVKETPYIKDIIKWGADYLISSYASGPNKFVAVCGNDTLDFFYFGPFEEYPYEYPCSYVTADDPGTEIPAEAAAALAATSIVFKADDPEYAATALKAAQGLYAFAKANPKSYMDSTNPGIQVHAKLYPSTGYFDELAWAAAWLYNATGTASYLTDARSFYQQATATDAIGYAFESGEKRPGLHVLLWQLDPAQRSTYATAAKTFFDRYTSQNYVPYTARGLAYPYHWGALRPTMNMAFLALTHSKNLRTNGGDASYAASLFNFASTQVNYVLGDSGRSWVVGFGTGYPTYLWHKLSYNSYIDYPTRGQYVFRERNGTLLANPFPTKADGTIATAFNPYPSETSVFPILCNPTSSPYCRTYYEAGGFDILSGRLPQKFIAYGALYAAPLKDDNMIVGRKDYTYAEPTTDGNGGLAGALAGLTAFYGGSAASDCGLDLGWTHPNATLTTKSVNNTAACAGSVASQSV